MGGNISIHALLAESDIALLVQPIRRQDFYPRSPCGERRVTVLGIQHRVGISIHALLAESDGGSGVGSWPRGIFLSTLSLRRATAPNHNPCSRSRNFYPRSPCGERLWPGLLARPFFIISIHALLAESDGGGLLSCFVKIIFLSTLSLRRATLSFFDF